MNGIATEHVNCPICDIDDASPFVMSNGYQVARCGGCGLLYVNPRVSSASVSKHFEEEYIPDRERAEFAFISIRNASLAREAGIVKKYLPDGGGLLDVGSASGAFLSHFSGNPAWSVSGVEPSSFAAEYSREKFGLNVFTGFLRDQNFESSSFDVVTSLDAFYFHPWPDKDVEEIARILKPGGHCAIEIPGLNFRLLKNTGIVCRLLYRESARLNAGFHLFFYSRETLSKLMAKHGFTMVAFYPEQSPMIGSAFSKTLNNMYYKISGAMYRSSNGKINYASKEIIVFRKAEK